MTCKYFKEAPDSENCTIDGMVCKNWMEWHAWKNRCFRDYKDFCTEQADDFEPVKI